MKIDRKELDRRAAEADRARLALRRATLELLTVRDQLLKEHKLSKEAGILIHRTNPLLVTTTPTPAQIEKLLHPTKPTEHSGDSESEFPR